METSQSYLNQLNAIELVIKNQKHIKNLFIGAKILLFIAGVVFAYKYTNAPEQTYLIYSSIVLFVLFIATSVLDSSHMVKLRLSLELKKTILIELDYLKGEYNQLSTGKEFVDSNHAYSSDLDIFGFNSLFQHINRTVTFVGRQTLADWLLSSKTNEREILARQEAVKELKEASDWRFLLKATGSLNKDNESILEKIGSWKDSKRIVSSKLMFVVYTLTTINIAGYVAVFLIDMNITYPLFFSTGLLIYTSMFVKKTNEVHQDLDHFVKAFTNLHLLIQVVDQQEFKSAKLKGIRKVLLEGEKSALDGFKTIKSILSSFDQRANLFVTVVLNGLYLREVYLLNNLDKWKEEYHAHIIPWLVAFGELDAICSLSNYAFNHPDFVLPEIVESKLLSATNFGHPAISQSKRVNNNFSVGALNNTYIVTGANMAGKSTFLRSVGVNLVLASCGSFVCASKFEFQPMSIFSSMRTSDNLSDETSYFHAELKRLKQLTELAKVEDKLFIILDEILKGTNSTDKLQGSIKFLTKLLDYPLSGIVATHDLVLGKDLEERFPSNFSNICFEIEIKGKDIVYDYLVKPGISKNMNASLLMENLGLV